MNTYFYQLPYDDPLFAKNKEILEATYPHT